MHFVSTQQWQYLTFQTQILHLFLNMEVMRVFWAQFPQFLSVNYFGIHLNLVFKLLIPEKNCCRNSLFPSPIKSGEWPARDFQPVCESHDADGKKKSNNLCVHSLCLSPAEIGQRLELCTMMYISWAYSYDWYSLTNFWTLFHHCNSGFENWDLR